MFHRRMLARQLSNARCDPRTLADDVTNRRMSAKLRVRGDVHAWSVCDDRRSVAVAPHLDEVCAEIDEFVGKVGGMGGEHDL